MLPNALCIDINGDVDAVVFLALAICEDGTAILTKIIDKATNIAWFLAKNTVLKSITFEFINICYDYLIINMMTNPICESHLWYLSSTLYKTAIVLVVHLSKDNRGFLSAAIWIAFAITWHPLEKKRLKI